MSKMVVGMKRNPAIKPHKIDCGFLNTVRKALIVVFKLPPCCSALCSFGNRKKRTDSQTDDAHSNPKSLPGHAATNQWANCKLPGRPAGHSKHLSCANQRCGTRRREVLGGDIDCPDQREDSSCPLQKPPYTRDLSVAQAEEQCSNADHSGGHRKNLLRSNAIHGGASDETERRISVVEQTNQ
jgi:hypothetical protein